MYWNVHVDGLEFTHDLIVEREGVFKECVAAIKMAKILGYQTATNTTVYKETDVQEMEDMFAFLSSLEVDGHTISPGYEYDAAKKDMVKRLGKQPEDFFLTRKMTRQKFARDPGMGQEFHHLRHAGLSGVPRRQTRIDLHRLGDSDLQRAEAGKLPCYLMTDGHYAGYQEMLAKVHWDKYGVVDGVARDPRCENCMVHCGYDPSGALGTNYQRGDNWKNFRYNFGAKPKPLPATARIDQTRLQRRDDWQRPSGRGQGRDQFPARRNERSASGLSAPQEPQHHDPMSARPLGRHWRHLRAR